MSENTSSSMQTTDSTTSSEPAPESIAPKKGGKKKLWIIIAAVVVVALLIGATAYVFLLNPKLEAEIGPTPITVDAGKQKVLWANATYGGDAVTTDVTYAWSVPATLGHLSVVAQKQTTFTATDTGFSGNNPITGTLTCAVTYKGDTVTVTEDVTINPPYLDSVSVLGAKQTLSPSESYTYSADALNSVGDNITSSCTFQWSVTGMAAGDYTLSATTGVSVEFTGLVEGIAVLTVVGTYQSVSKSGSKTIDVTTTAAVRTVDYYWYDMFNVSYATEWWQTRGPITGNDWVLSSSYPYLEVWEGTQPGNTYIYGSMRMDMAARNLTEMNMASHPEILPYLGSARGGTAIVDWELGYITYDRGENVLGISPAMMAWYDGWFVELNGTVTLDRQAAMAVLGVTSGGFDDFDTWWTSNGVAVQTAWGAWILDEANNPERLDIFNMYEYYFQPVLWEIDAQKVGDQVVVTMESVSWGMEALLTRWLHEAFMPTEWYFEEFEMSAVIGPETTDMDIDTGVAYGIYAYETTLDGKPCWDWEAMLQDYVPSSPEYPVSEFDKYIGYQYENTAPGSSYYGQMMDYDYAPGAWNLSEGEVLTLEWPDGQQRFFLHEGSGVTSNVSTEMTVVYAEPMPSDAPSQIVIDETARTISFTGPFDMWTWSSTQTAHEFLADEWIRLDGLLPYGMPFIEFSQETGVEPPYAANLEMTGIPAAALVGETIDFDVAVFDQYADPFPDYTGTVEFTSTDTAATLPVPYTYSGSESSHAFQMSFDTVGTHSVTVADQANALLTDTVTDVDVTETQVYHFVVVVNQPALGVIAGEETTATVTIQNQYDVTYTGYTGTVNFTSTDGAASLPADYPFVSGDAGTKDFSVTFGTDGTQTLAVTDVADSSITGSADVVVQAAAAASYLVLEVPGGLAEQDVPIDLIVTVYDQYDRVYTPYAGTITFSTNRTGEVTLPADYTFDGTEGGTVTLQVTFTASGMFSVSASDTVDPGITGSVDVQVVTEAPVLDHFVVSGITNMWEDNYSDVTVEAITQFSTRFVGYLGTVTFTSDAVSGATLPADYTFTAGDAGIVTLAAAVSFADPGIYTVTVEDTVDPSAVGSQANIMIEDLVPTTLTISGAPASVATGGTISLTVTVYDQYGNVEDEYTGTVTFSSSDSSATLPADYTFVSGDAGTHSFVDEITLVTLGDQTVTVEDVADPGLVDTVTVTVTAPEGLPSLDYTLYDMFQQPWGEWWDIRPSAWPSDYILSDVPGKNVLLYNKGSDAGAADATFMLYAPYRWTIDGKNLSAAETIVNVYHPEFWPKFGADVAGSQATMDIYMEYINTDWWSSYWMPNWGTNDDWPGDTYPDSNDGYFVGTVYELKMNPECAETWMGIPVGDDPIAWWTANSNAYLADWKTWVQGEGRTRLDIYCGYEWAYTAMVQMGDISVAPDGDIVFKLAHISWGWEVLLTRWITEANLCNHEPWYEDTTINVTYDANMINFTLDGVCQYSMHAVKANGSASNDAAWIWEPQNIDYIVKNPHPSDYLPYLYLTYQSWNSGDEEFGNEIAYEGTPTVLNFADYMTLVIQLAAGTDVIGYLGEGVPDGSGLGLPGDLSPWQNLEIAGEMDLGYYLTNPADPLDLSSMYDPASKTLTIEGPATFDNPRGGGLLYHGSPWIEFNVVPTKVASTGAEAPTLSESASASSAITEVLTLAAVLSIVMVTLVAFGAIISRGREY